jgi:hypothetical protein
MRVPARRAGRAAARAPARKHSSTKTTISFVRRSGVSRSSRIDEACTSSAFGISRISLSESENGWIGSR